MTQFENANNSSPFGEIEGFDNKPQVPTTGFVQTQNQPGPNDVNIGSENMNFSSGNPFEAAQNAQIQQNQQNPIQMGSNPFEMINVDQQQQSTQMNNTGAFPQPTPFQQTSPFQQNSFNNQQSQFPSNQFNQQQYTQPLFSNNNFNQQPGISQFNNMPQVNRQNHFNQPQQVNGSNNQLERKYNIIDLCYIINPKFKLLLDPNSQVSFEQNEAHLMIISFNMDFNNLRISLKQVNYNPYEHGVINVPSLIHLNNFAMYSESCAELLYSSHNNRFIILDKMYSNNANWVPNKTEIIIDTNKNFKNYSIQTVNNKGQSSFFSLQTVYNNRLFTKVLQFMVNGTSWFVFGNNRCK